MTRKHFEAFAAAIARIEDPNEREKVANLLGPILWDSNPRFDESRFRAACDLHNDERDPVLDEPIAVFKVRDRD